MSYSLGMSPIDNSSIKIEKLKQFCNENSDYKFDDTKTWTNLFDQIVLYKIGDKWDYVCGLNNESNYVDTVSPDSDLFEMACKIADSLNLFIYGEENEIYYIPIYGQPKQHIDFEIAKAAFLENGYDLDLIIEKATVEH
jgi:alpha-D-ribose 1-methylphosphonate 5-phosphate C-P lyase